MDYKAREGLSKLALWDKTGQEASLSFTKPRPPPGQPNHWVIMWRKEHSGMLGPSAPPAPTLGQILGASGQAQQVVEAEKPQGTRCEQQGVGTRYHAL